MSFIDDGMVWHRPHRASYADRQRLDHMRSESATILAANPALRGPYGLPPVTVPLVPSEFVPARNARPVDVAKAFLAYHLDAGPVRVNALTAKAAGFGIAETTLRRAKKSLSINAIRRDDEWFWSFAANAGTP
jgi:hypothetical protein